MPNFKLNLATLAHLTSFATVLSLGACTRVITAEPEGPDAGAGAGAPGAGVTVAGVTSGGAGMSDPDNATSQQHPPIGTWSMIVQYGPVGQPVQPTIPMQVELRNDGAAYAWVCAGAPADGTLSKSCAPPSRSNCLLGSFAWTGTRWRVDFPANHIDGTPNQGDVAPDGNGNILISYINPTYSGALFKWVDQAIPGVAGCTL